MGLISHSVHISSSCIIRSVALVIYASSMINAAFSAIPPSDSAPNRYSPAPQKPTLESVVLQIGDAVLASTDTVDCVAERLNELTQQVQQQGYQIFALSEEVQALTLLHTKTLERLEAIATRLEHAGLVS